MTQKTLDLIHECYVEAVKNSYDILDIARNFHKRISELEFPKETDEAQFDKFVDGVSDCVRTRTLTNDMTNFVQSISLTLVYIVIFMNERKEKGWDISIIGRRKALEKHLTKVLMKASKGESSARIRDLFGLKMVWNNTSSISNEEIVSGLAGVSNAVQGILCGCNRKLREEFEQFIKELDDPIVASQVTIILNMDFECESLKDYVSNPKKDNGYQTIQFSLRVGTGIKYYGGAVLELQIRTREMDHKAEDPNGDWSHSKYSDKLYGKGRPLFTVPDELFSNLDIAGFTGYGELGDADGIGREKIIVNRRVSPNLTPHYK